MQERESAPAYAAFKCYWELGDERTLREVEIRCKTSQKSVYLWRIKWRWDERIDDYTGAVRKLWLEATAKEFEKAADALAEARLRYTLKSIEVSTALQAKGLEVVKGLQVFETEKKITSADGKTTQITLRPAANIRLSDGARLILAGNDNLAAAEAGIAQVRGCASRNGRADGSSLPDPSAEPPEVVVFLDGGDGVPMPLSTLPPPDELDPYFNPFDGSSRSPLDTTVTEGEGAEK